VTGPSDSPRKTISVGRKRTERYRNQRPAFPPPAITSFALFNRTSPLSFHRASRDDDRPTFLPDGSAVGCPPWRLLLLKRAESLPLIYVLHLLGFGRLPGRHGSESVGTPRRGWVVSQPTAGRPNWRWVVAPSTARFRPLGLDWSSLRAGTGGWSWVASGQFDEHTGTYPIWPNLHLISAKWHRRASSNPLVWPTRAPRNGRLIFVMQPDSSCALFTVHWKSERTSRDPESRIARAAGGDVPLSRPSAHADRCSHLLVGWSRTVGDSGCQINQLTL
jgi:hypothetical protein